MARFKLLWHAVILWSTFGINKSVHGECNNYKSPHESGVSSERLSFEFCTIYTNKTGTPFPGCKEMIKFYFSRTTNDEKRHMTEFIDVCQKHFNTLAHCVNVLHHMGMYCWTMADIPRFLREMKYGDVTFHKIMSTAPFMPHHHWKLLRTDQINLAHCYYTYNQQNYKLRDNILSQAHKVFRGKHSNDIFCDCKELFDAGENLHFNLRIYSNRKYIELLKNSIIDTCLKPRPTTTELQHWYPFQEKLINAEDVYKESQLEFKTKATAISLVWGPEYQSDNSIWSFRNIMDTISLPYLNVKIAHNFVISQWSGLAADLIRVNFSYKMFETTKSALERELKFFPELKCDLDDMHIRLVHRIFAVKTAIVSPYEGDIVKSDYFGSILKLWSYGDIWDCEQIHWAYDHLETALRKVRVRIFNPKEFITQGQLYKRSMSHVRRCALFASKMESLGWKSVLSVLQSMLGYYTQEEDFMNNLVRHKDACRGGFVLLFTKNNTEDFLEDFFTAYFDY